VAQNRIVRVLQVTAMKHPVTTMAALFGSYFALYHFVDQLPFAREILDTLMMLFSSETAVVMLYRAGQPFKTIVTRLFLAESFVFVFDQLVVTGLLRWGWTRELIDALSRWGKAFIRDIKAKFRAMFPELANSDSAFMRFLMRLFSAYHEPHKAGLKIVFALGLIPKPPLIPVGGFSIGVLVVRYNGYGWRGWLALLSGMLLRNTLWLLGVYGVGALL